MLTESPKRASNGKSIKNTKSEGEGGRGSIPVLSKDGVNVQIHLQRAPTSIMLCTLPAFYTVQPRPRFLGKALSTAMKPQAAPCLPSSLLQCEDLAASSLSHSPQSPCGRASLTLRGSPFNHFASKSSVLLLRTSAKPLARRALYTDVRFFISAAPLTRPDAEGRNLTPPQLLPPCPAVKCSAPVRGEMETRKHCASGKVSPYRSAISGLSSSSSSRGPDFPRIFQKADMAFGERPGRSP